MGNDSIVYIRTDGNDKIATGHLVRCLCLAQCLNEVCNTICFIVSDSISSSLLKDLWNSLFTSSTFPFEINILDSAVFYDLEAEIDELCNLIGEKEYLCSLPLLIVDSYYVTPSYFGRLKQAATVVYIDDLKAFDYEVDIVINYDVIPLSQMDEYKQFYSKAKKTLLGAQYTPLRRQFQNQKIEFRPKLQNILITTGGSDPYNFTCKLITYLHKHRISLDLHIVIGKLFHHTTDLESLSLRYSNIHLYQDVKNMAALMKQCDFAISAAGTTLYELCALGIPSISISMADNQVTIAKAFSQIGAVFYAGDIRIESVYETILEYLSTMANDSALRYQQQEIMHSLVDGNGVLRIVENLLSL